MRRMKPYIFVTNGISIGGKRTWYLRTDSYKKGLRTRHYFHKLLLPNVPLIDHKDGDGLNNCKDNLRFADCSRNAWNGRARGGSSQFKGVCWAKNRKKWAVQITRNSEHYNLGRYQDELLAAAVYDLHALALFGEFAQTNLGVHIGRIE
jgi:hypothetical protein